VTKLRNLFTGNRRIISALVVWGALTACQPNGSYIILVTATPSGQVPSAEGGGGIGLTASTPVPPAGAGVTETIFTAPTPTFIPTPDPTRTGVSDATEDQVHIVQSGDTLNRIAEWYGVSPEAIISVNGLADPNRLEVGQTLIIPTSIQVIGPDFKIIPDSELVYGPALRDFDIFAFVERYPDSYLARYSEDLNGGMWTGAQIIDRVALEQSISPRLLLALLEYESNWLSLSAVTEEAALYPMGYLERPGQTYGLYRQLDWAGKMLNAGYYGWRQRGLAATLLADGMRVGLHPAINAGTAGVQVLLAQTRLQVEWVEAVQHTGFIRTYTALFGDPFQYAVEPLIPAGLTQPPMSFPWSPEETWYFTGGPHGGWGSSSAWAALDFVPTDTVDIGCSISPSWARAVADGVIARSEYGIVILDLDGDGFEGTGWTVFYLHLTSADRPVVAGQQVRQGDPVGHPECEGGVSWATHLHIARRYNGEWIAADCSSCTLTVPAPPLDFNGWVASSYLTEYDGALVRGDEYREACTCREPLNTFTPADYY
jgi:LysM repeat protein